MFIDKNHEIFMIYTNKPEITLMSSQRLVTAFSECHAAKLLMPGLRQDCRQFIYSTTITHHAGQTAHNGKMHLVSYQTFAQSVTGKVVSSNYVTVMS
jgi:hypothetical protein